MSYLHFKCFLLNMNIRKILTTIFPSGLSHPVLGLGPGPLELGKIAAFCLKLGKITRHILLSIYVIPLTCLSVHVSLYIQYFYKSTFDFTFYFTYYSTQICHFSPLLFSFFSRSQIRKTWGLNWEKKILFSIGNGTEYRPQIRQIESPVQEAVPVTYELAVPAAVLNTALLCIKNG